MIINCSLKVELKYMLFFLEEREIYEVLNKLEIGAKALKDYGIHFFKVSLSAKDIRKVNTST